MLSCMLTAEEREQKRISREIERQLAQDDKKQRKEMKLLLLGERSTHAARQADSRALSVRVRPSTLAGPGESGKSTFIKQMRIIHGKGYSPEELAAFRKLIHSNVVTAMQSLLEGAEELNMRLSKDMKVRAGGQTIGSRRSDEGVCTCVRAHVLC